MRKRAKKNHRIILWEVLSGIGSPSKTTLSYYRLWHFRFREKTRFEAHG
jgi:hypothetical protein